MDAGRRRRIRLMGDWRRVGYRRGRRKPRATGPPSRRAGLGIRPDEPDDVSGRLQAALDDLGASGGGVLQLDAGRYVLDRPLFVHDSHVVLRGAGKHATTLFFPRPLAESLDPGTFWSWTGGQIFFTARERLAASMARGWRARTRARRSDAHRGLARRRDPGHRRAGAARRGGARRRRHERARAGRHGAARDRPTAATRDHRMLREMGGDVEGALAYPWDTTQLDGAVWRWPVVVSEVLVAAARPSAATAPDHHPPRDPGSVSRELGPTVHDSGVEGLTIENALRPRPPTT